jgi:hypothetical protein
MLFADPAIPGEVVMVDRATAAQLQRERRKTNKVPCGHRQQTPRHCWQSLYRRRRESLAYLAALVAKAGTPGRRSPSHEMPPGVSGSNSHVGSDWHNVQARTAPRPAEAPSSVPAAGDAAAWDRLGRDVVRQLDERLERLVRRARLDARRDPLAPLQPGVFGGP